MNGTEKIINKYRELISSLAREFDEGHSDLSAHYASYDKGMDILRTQNLQCTEFRSINDPSRSEIVKGFEVTLETIEKFCHSLTKSTNQDYFFGFLCQFYRLLPQNCNIKPRHIEIWGKIAPPEKMVASSYYTFSFSKKIDHPSMWDDFGNNGTGLSIVFKPKKFNTALNSEDYPMIYIEVLYDIEKFQSRIWQYLQATWDFLGMHEVKKQEMIDDLHTELCSQLLAYIPGLLKFETEAEYRMYQFEFKYGNDKPFPRDLSERKFKDGDQDKLNTPDAFTSNGIEAIWIGPKSKKSDTDIRSELNSFEKAGGGMLYPNASSIKIFKSTWSQTD